MQLTRVFHSSPSLGRALVRGLRAVSLCYSLRCSCRTTCICTIEIAVMYNPSYMPSSESPFCPDLPLLISFFSDLSFHSSSTSCASHRCTLLLIWVSFIFIFKSPQVMMKVCDEDADTWPIHLRILRRTEAKKRLGGPALSKEACLGCIPCRE